MKGYKVFDPNWTCRGLQYQVGESYEMDVEPIICDRGFHFCKELENCFKHYAFNPQNKVAEVEAYGDVISECGKSCTNKIKIIRELTWHEVLDLVNTGKNCTGNRNSGDWNSGDWNSGSNCTGCFNTISQPLMFFDKPSDITFNQWRKSDAYWLLNRIDFRPTEWIMMSDMTDVEKEKHPEYETTGGYLRNVDNSECCAEWWDGLTEKEKAIIKAIPNFDSKKFYQITGIKAD